jgi:hypothetical protein
MALVHSQLQLPTILTEGAVGGKDWRWMDVYDEGLGQAVAVGVGISRSY